MRPIVTNVLWFVCGLCVCCMDATATLQNVASCSINYIKKEYIRSLFLLFYLFYYFKFFFHLYSVDIVYLLLLFCCTNLASTIENKLPTIEIQGQTGGVDVNPKPETLGV